MIYFKRYWVDFLIEKLVIILVISLSTQLIFAEEKSHLKDNKKTFFSIPVGKGLPVVVHTGLFFHNIESFDEGKNTFEATIDLRLTWHDSRLSYPVSEALYGYKEYRFSEADEKLKKIWTPSIRLANQIGEPIFSEKRLRIYPNGRIETITRTNAAYKTPVDIARFPFDRQSLQIELLTKEDTVDLVDLDYTFDDLVFSKVENNKNLYGWKLGHVNLKRELVAGWNGDRYSKVIIDLNIQRNLKGIVATIFIPLFASLLIPFLATWMNRAVKGGFEIDGFELANYIIGGLFAVIALNFTIDTSFPLLSKGDNTVTRLLGLNYAALATGLMISVIFYRYKFPARWLGDYVQEEMFIFISWAFPLLFLTYGLGFLLLAAA